MPSKTILIGNLGKDPELRRTQQGTAVANLSVATSDRWKDKTTGEWTDKTEWHKVVAWGQLAEYAANNLQKGDTVYVEGQNQTRKWEDKSGVDRYTTEVVAKEISRLSTRQKASDEPDDDLPF